MHIVLLVVVLKEPVNGEIYILYIIEKQNNFAVP